MAGLFFLLRSLRSFVAIPVPERGGHRIGYWLFAQRRPGVPSRPLRQDE